MIHELEVYEADDLASAAADHVESYAQNAVERRGEFTLALSGGRTPWPMLKELAARDLPWGRTQVLQVDERIAPPGDPARNLTNIEAALGATAATIHAMPVDEADVDAAAEAYAAELPDHIDLVHLGLGADGHTASLIPGDPVLQVTRSAVAVTTTAYQGYRRMTLTYPGLRRARQLMWLVVGADKQPALQGLLASEAETPAGRVEADASLVLASRSAVEAA